MGHSADFPPLASSLQSAEASVFRDSSDSQVLKDNELDLLKSQSILQDLVPVSGDSSEAKSNQRASKRVGKDKGSSANRSNSAAGPTVNICFSNSQEFASLLTNSELDGNNEITTVHNEQSNVSNENISANSTERSNEVVNNSSANSAVNEVINNNSTEKVNEVIDNSSTERSNEVNDITVNESNESNVAIVENVLRWSLLM